MESKILEFEKVEHENYGTRSFFIQKGYISLEKVEKHCKIIKIDTTKYGYKKAVIQLDDNICPLIVSWETQINKFLEEAGYPQ